MTANHPNHIRKNEVSHLVQRLLQGRRYGTTHVPAKNLNQTEIRYAMQLGLPHRIKAEDINPIGICLTFA